MVPRRNRGMDRSLGDPLRLGSTLLACLNAHACHATLTNSPRPWWTSQMERDAGPQPGVKHPAAVALGRKGGVIGGKARADKLPPEERSESARKAAEARGHKS